MEVEEVEGDCAEDLVDKRLIKEVILGTAWATPLKKEAGAILEIELNPQPPNRMGKLRSDCAADGKGKGRSNFRQIVLLTS